MWREFATLTIGTPSRPVADRSLVVTLEAHAAGVLLLGDRRFDVEWTSGEGPVAAHRDGESVFVPNEFLRHPLELRARRPGDNIRLAAGSRTLKKLFIDSRVPKTERQSVPVLACGQTVLWVYGLAVAEGVETGESGRASGPGIRVQIRPTAAASVRRTGICSVYRG